MTNNNINDCPELEQMRAQYEMLKQDIEENVQIKQEKLKKVVKSNLGDTILGSKFIIVVISLAILFVIYVIIDSNSIDEFKGWFLVFIMIACIFWLLWSIRKTRQAILNIETNVLDVKTYLTKQIQDCNQPLWKDFILFIILWFVYSFLTQGNNVFHEPSIFLISLICPVIMTFSSRHNRKERRKKFEDMLKQLDEPEELDKEENKQSYSHTL